MKRVIAGVIAALVFVPFTGARADESPYIVQGAGIAAAAVAAGQVDPNVDFWPMYSESSIDNESSHTLSGAVWPGFLLDAFFWLYGYQPTERAGFGISESQWPNAPNTSSASSSDFLLSNMKGGCEQFFGAGACAPFFASTPPIALGSSSSRSAHLSSSGFARGLAIDVPGLLEATEARTSTSTKFVDGHTVVESIFKARDVTIGGQLHIESIIARSFASAAGTREGSRGSSTFEVLGATLAGVPVVIDDQGMHVQGDGGLDPLNDVLNTQGIEVRSTLGRTRINPTGEFVDSATGGLFIHILRSRAEETLPTPLIAQKDAACASAAGSPLNQEITRIRFDQPNPLYGQIPLPGVPARAQLEQSVPPPFECPFLNRDFGVTLALGFTEASARLSPVPEVKGVSIEGPGVSLGTPATTKTVFIPGTPGITPGTVTIPEQQTVLASAPQTGEDGARRIQALYGVFLLLIAFAVAGRFVLKFVSNP